MLSRSFNLHDCTPLHLAALNGRTTMALIFGENGANREAVLSNGHTPLHVPAEEGKTEILSMLLENGANEEATDIDGRTPLYLAAF